MFAGVIWCHLYFGHHVVVRLQVHGEGLSHLSLTVVQDINLHPVFLLALLELDIFDADAFDKKKIKRIH